MTWLGFETRPLDPNTRAQTIETLYLPLLYFMKLGLSISKLLRNTLTLQIPSDQDRIFPHNISTLSIRLLKSIIKNIK